MSFKIVIFAAAVFTYQVNAQMGLIRPFATGFTNGISEMTKPFIHFGQSAMGPASEYFPGRNPRFQWITYPAQMIPQAPAGTFEGFEGIASAFPGANYFQAVNPPNVVKPQPQYYQIPSQSGAVRPPRPYPISDTTSSLNKEAAEQLQSQYNPISSQSGAVRPPRPYIIFATVPSFDKEAAEQFQNQYNQISSQSSAVKPQPYPASADASSLDKEATEEVQSQDGQISSQSSTVRPPSTNPDSDEASSLSEESVEIYRPSSLLIQPNSAETEISQPKGAMTLEGKLEIPAMKRPFPLIEDDE